MPSHLSNLSSLPSFPDLNPSSSPPTPSSSKNLLIDSRSVLCMEVFLHEKDAADWAYKGEGAANLVLDYTGSSLIFVGKVLRLQKAPRKEKDDDVTNMKFCANGESVLAQHERLIWRDCKELLSSSSKESLERLYVQYIIRPLLGPEHVEIGTRMLVSRQFLEFVQKTVQCKRPAMRVDAADVDMRTDSVLLMSDHSVFSNGILKGEQCIAVEIKPKCGFSQFQNL